MLHSKFVFDLWFPAFSSSCSPTAPAAHKMGINGLRELLKANAPRSMMDHDLEYYCKKRIAMDLSIILRQCMAATDLQHKGESTSHINGMFVKTANFMQYGILPIFVFDGIPPAMKKSVLAKREAIRQAAKSEIAKRAGAKKDVTGVVKDGDKGRLTDEQLRKKSLKPTSKHYDDCRKLFALMGIPFIEATSEAEAMCSHLCKDEANKVYGVASEDMDCLPFGAPRMLLNFKSAEGTIVQEIDCAKALDGLKLNMDEFIDLCILCGCDYCDTIKDIKGKDALELIRKHRSIENIMREESNHQYPVDWPYKEARNLFKEPEVNKDVPLLELTSYDTQALIQFLVAQNGFNQNRVEGYIEKIVYGTSLIKRRSIDDIFKPSAPKVQDLGEGKSTTEMPDSKEVAPLKRKFERQSSMLKFFHRKDSEEGTSNKKPSKGHD